MKKETNPFDETIRQKLEGLRPAFKEEHWEAMEQLLDEEWNETGVPVGKPQEQEGSLDELVFDKLHRFEVPAQPNHWNKLETQLNEIFFWQKEMLQLKLTEIGLVSLLLLFLWHWSPQENQSFMAKEPVAQIELADTTTTTLTLAPEQNRTQETPPSAIADAPLPIDRTSEMSTGIDLPASEERSETKDGRLLKGENALSQAVLSAESAVPSLNNELTRISANEEGTAKAEMPLAAETAPQATANTSVIGLLLPPEYLSVDLKALDYPQPPALSLEELSIPPQKTRSYLRVGMFGSADYNAILVPTNEEKNIEEATRRSGIGYGTGVTMSLAFKRWEIESGAYYSARNYPLDAIFIEGGLQNGINSARLQSAEQSVVHIPLNVRYNFIHKTRWRAYVLSGASIHVALQAFYDVKEEPQFTFQPSAPPLPGSEPRNNTVLTDLKDDGKGWLEGGTFEENAFLSANLSIGLERYISPKWSLFVQPYYQYSFYYFGDGLGPIKEHINSFSIMVGAKTNLR